MPDIKKYKSVAVPIPTWEKLWAMAEKNHRSPKDSDVRHLYSNLQICDT